MFKWVNGSDLKKGDVFMVSTGDGLATAVKVVQLKGKNLFIEFFNFENNWEKISDPVSVEEIADFTFLKVG